MNALYTVIAAIICGVLIVAIDILITNVCAENSVMQRNYFKMPLAYTAGIFMFLKLINIIFS